MAVRKKKAPKSKAAGKAKSAVGRSTKPSGGTASKKGAAPSAKKASKAPKPAAKRPAPKPAAKAKKAPARKDAAREKAALLKQKEREKKEREREKAAALKEKEREKKEREREKAAALKLKEREQAQKEKERLRLQAEKEKLEAKLRAEKEAEKKRVLAEREAEKEAARKAKEEEKARIKAEKEAEKARIIAEREAEKEAVRKAKEEERARRDAEREAYRKAKEAERERLRAEREAARRLRESKAARASKNAQRERLRVGSSRVYNPAAVPNQSGTTRRHLEMPQRFVGVRHEYPAAAAPAIPPPAPPPALPELESPSGDREARPAEVPLPPVPVAESEDGSQPVQGEARPTPPPPAPVEAIDERYRLINERLAKVDESFRRQYEESFEMSWIHHDSALEGVVYTFQELKTAMDPTVTVVPDSSMQPVCEEIRRHRQAIAYVRELGERKRVPINVDVIKKLYVILHPEEGDVKTVKYRKDIPQHRLYFHEYAPPDKIAYRVRQAIDWLNGPEPKKIKNPIRIAARVHFDLVRTFPFPNDSGKVARLLMNVLLLRAGYPPAIIHSTERQRYYEALKGQLPIIVMLVNESITNALMSIEKLLDEYEARV